MSGNRLTFSATLQDKVSDGLALIEKRFKSANTQASLLGNLGAMSVAKGFSLVDNAISGVVGILGDANRAAMEEEGSISRLGASLKANIEGWDGNTDAIERVLKARMSLGFSDDEQRESLSTLVIATHNVTKALDVERVAMDLARLKRISLSDASEALTKVEAGSYRILKSLGIALKDGATQADALRSVEKAAAGQAEAFAKTNEGKLLVSQVKVGESMEHLGAVTMPLVASATEAVADEIEKASLAFDLLNGKLPQTEDGFKDLDQFLSSINPANWTLGPGLGMVQDKAEEAAARTQAALEFMADHAKDDFDRVDRALHPTRYATEQLGDTAEEAAKKYDEAMKDIVDSVKRASGDLEDAASDVADSMFDPLEERAELYELDQEARRQRGIRNAAEAGSKEREEANHTLDTINDDTIKVLGKLAAAGDAEAAARLKAMAAAAIASGKLSAAQIADLNKLLLKIHIAEIAFKDLARLSFQASHNKDDTYIPHRAGGGPVYPGEFIVGEDGLEKLTINRDGTGWVTPLAGKPTPGVVAIPRMTGGGGSRTLIVPLVINGRQFAAATIPDIDEEDYWRGQTAGGSTLEN